VPKWKTFLWLTCYQQLITTKRTKEAALRSWNLLFRIRSFFKISFVERTILMFGAKLCINESHIQPCEFRFCLTTSNASYVLQCSLIDFLKTLFKNQWKPTLNRVIILARMPFPLVKKKNDIVLVHISPSYLHGTGIKRCTILSTCLACPLCTDKTCDWHQRCSCHPVLVYIKHRWSNMWVYKKKSLTNCSCHPVSQYPLMKALINKLLRAFRFP